MTALHAEIVLELDLPASPERVFSAFDDSEQRGRWVRMPGARNTVQQDFDLRPGATEVARSVFTVYGRQEHLELRTTWLEVRRPDRIVGAQVFLLDGRTRWASLLTWEFEPAATSTRLRRTEQLAVLEPSDPHPADGVESRDVSHQRGGARLQLNGLAALFAP